MEVQRARTNRTRSLMDCLRLQDVVDTRDSRGSSPLRHHTRTGLRWHGEVLFLSASSIVQPPRKVRQRRVERQPCRCCLACANGFGRGLGGLTHHAPQGKNPQGVAAGRAADSLTRMSPASRPPVSHALPHGLKEQAGPSASGPGHGPRQRRSGEDVAQQQGEGVVEPNTRLEAVERPGIACHPSPYGLSAGSRLGLRSSTRFSASVSCSS